jgi:hypothetical protein
MGGYPAYQNKVWKWDFAPGSVHTSTRPVWRLFAYVQDSTSEPILAIPFLVHPRSQMPGGNPADYVAEALKKFLTENIEIKAEEDRFKHQTMADGSVRSMCYTCWETVAVSTYGHVRN